MKRMPIHKAYVARHSGDVHCAKTHKAGRLHAQEISQQYLDKIN